MSITEDEIANHKLAKRIADEKRVVRRLLAELKEAGWTIHAIDNGAGEEPVPATELTQISEISATDECHISFEKSGKYKWVYLVFGNSAEELISDYLTSPNQCDNFESTVELVTKWAETL